MYFLTGMPSCQLFNFNSISFLQSRFHCVKFLYRSNSYSSGTSYNKFIFNFSIYIKKIFSA